MTSNSDSNKEGSAGARRPDAKLIKDLFLPTSQANWRPAEGVGDHDYGVPGAPLRTTSLRLRTMEKGLGKVSIELAPDRQA